MLLIRKEISVQDPRKVQVLFEIQCYTATIHQTAELTDGLINHISPIRRQQFQITQWSFVLLPMTSYSILMEDSLLLINKWLPKLG